MKVLAVTTLGSNTLHHMHATAQNEVIDFDHEIAVIQAAGGKEFPAGSYGNRLFIPYHAMATICSVDSYSLDKSDPPYRSPL
jgi:hypothetical protein